MHHILWSNMDVLKFITVKYSLHYFNKTIAYQKTFHLSHATELNICSSTYGILSQPRGVIHKQNVHYSITSETDVLSFLTVRYSLHKCSKTYFADNSNCFTCFPSYRSSWKQNNLPSSSSDSNLVNFLLCKLVE